MRDSLARCIEEVTACKLLAVTAGVNPAADLASCVFLDGPTRAGSAPVSTTAFRRGVALSAARQNCNSCPGFGAGPVAQPFGRR
jgi:hypothetical protein